MTEEPKPLQKYIQITQRPHLNRRLTAIGEVWDGSYGSADRIIKGFYPGSTSSLKDSAEWLANWSLPGDMIYLEEDEPTPTACKLEEFFEEYEIYND